MNIIYIGTNGFPIGMATIQRQLLISKGFVLQGNDCLVLSQFSILEKDKKIKRRGEIEGVNYLCSSPFPYRPKNFILRSINKILGFCLQTFYIIKNKKNKTKNILFTVRTSFFNTVYYRILSLLFGYTYIGDINEALGSKKGASLNHRLFDKYGKFLYDGVLLISDSLMSNYNINTPKIKIPVICDVSKLDEINKITLEGFNLLYCASAAYIETLQFVIEVFEKTEGELNLILVISGSKNQMKTVKQMIKKSQKRDRIKLKSQIDYNKLIGLYKGADLLMIPLPEIEQHKSRFPHKIAEYTACKTPFISNKWGEVINYFDNENSFIVDNYSVNEYVSKIQSIMNIENKHIAEKSYEISKKNFDYKVLSNQINEFLIRV